MSPTIPKFARMSAPS